MSGRIEKRLAELGIALPTPAMPVAAYVPFVRTGSLLWIAGQLPMGMDPLPVATLTSADHAEGDLRPGTVIATAQAAARQCGINILAQARAALDDLDRVARVVKLVGFVKSDASFRQQPVVINGASQLMLDVFGEDGAHARSAVGVSSLPFGTVVEIEAVLEVRD